MSDNDALPTCLDEHDRLRLRAAAAEARAAASDFELLRAKIERVYHVGDGDTINLVDGSITRVAP